MCVTLLDMEEAVEFSDWRDSKYETFMRMFRQAFIHEGLAGIFEDFGPKVKGNLPNVGYEANSDMTPLEYLTRTFGNFHSAKGKSA